MSNSLPLALLLLLLGVTHKPAVVLTLWVVLFTGVAHLFGVLTHLVAVLARASIFQWSNLCMSLWGLKQLSVRAHKRSLWCSHIHLLGHVSLTAVLTALLVVVLTGGGSGERYTISAWSCTPD